MNKRNKVLAMAIAATMSAASQAAMISWGSIGTLSSDSDIDLSGSVQWAVNAGQDFLGGGGLVVIDGNAQAFEDVNLDYSVFGSSFFAEIDDHLPGENTSITFGVTTSRHPVALGTNDASLVGSCAGDQTCRTYDADTGNETFVSSSVFADARTAGEALNMTLRGLVAGNTYNIQLVATTAREDVFQSLEDGTGNILSGFNGVSSLGAGPSFVTGTFTADASTQDLNVILDAGRNPGISLAVLTEVTAVPVPAAAWLFGSALLGLWGARRRER